MGKCSICNKSITEGWKNWKTGEIICGDCFNETWKNKQSTIRTIGCG